MLHIDGVSAVLDRVPLLHPLSLSVPPGTVVGLIGHNGSGKSTALKLMARQMPLASGRVMIDGEDAATMDPRVFARHLGYMPQTLPLTPGLTGRDLVRLGRYPWHGALGRFGEEDHAAVEEALERTNTRPLAGRMVATLSGGERQRMWLAVLLAQKSRYLLLDEPISALDIAHQIHTLDLVRDLARSLGLGVIMVLHDINLAIRTCDRLAVLKGGHLQCDAPPSEVLARGVLDDVYGVTTHILTHPAHAAPVVLFGV